MSEKWFAPNNSKGLAEVFQNIDKLVEEYKKGNTYIDFILRTEGSDRIAKVSTKDWGVVIKITDKVLDEVMDKLDEAEGEVLEAQYDKAYDILAKHLGIDRVEVENEAELTYDGDAVIIKKGGKTYTVPLYDVVKVDIEGLKEVSIRHTALNEMEVVEEK